MDKPEAVPDPIHQALRKGSQWICPLPGFAVVYKPSDGDPWTLAACGSPAAVVPGARLKRGDQIILVTGQPDRFVGEDGLLVAVVPIDCISAVLVPADGDVPPFLSDADGTSVISGRPWEPEPGFPRPR